MRKSFRIISLLIINLFILTSFAFADPLHCKNPLETAVDLKMVKLHQYMLQEIAKHNNNNRVAGSAGYDQSAKYIETWLKYAGYKPVTQVFDFPYFQELSDPIFNQTAPNSVVYPPNVPEGFITLAYSGSGDITGTIQGVDLMIPMDPNNPPGTCNSGCEPEDFAGFIPGHIAFLQRGTCTFATKIANAQTAGAVAAFVINEGQPGRVDAIAGTLAAPDFTIPAVFVNYNIGVELFNLMQAGPVQVTLKVDAISEIRQTYNVIADTTGDDTHTVVVGAHLDSTDKGPGINDNGSGVACILETACKMGWLHIKPKYKVRFAFWSAEEEGLLGSDFYVNNLTPEELAKISMNLNFDMVASPNFVRFVYNGSDPNAPPGSDQIETLFNDYFAKKGLPTDPTALDGRSDYASFAAFNIAVGGLFAGADAVKTPEQVIKYGGTAGELCDPNYHTAKDDLTNLNYTIEKQMLKGLAYAVYTYGKTPLTVTTAKSLKALAYHADYKGPRAIR
jgi:Zn-dependent M28 family amino/carboxypeptidase